MTIKPIGAAASQAATAVANADPANRTLTYNTVSRGSKSGELKPAQQFENFVLQSFIEPMLPKDDGAYFGGGTAGSIWRSMLAERIGAEMAAAGGIGIAKMVEERNASIEAAASATQDLAKDAVATRGAELSKAGAR